MRPSHRVTTSGPQGTAPDPGQCRVICAPERCERRSADRAGFLAFFVEIGGDRSPGPVVEPQRICLRRAIADLLVQSRAQLGVCMIQAIVAESITVGELRRRPFPRLPPSLTRGWESPTAR